MSADGLVAHACGEDVIVFSLFSWTFNLMRFFLLVIKSIINSSALRCENEIFSMTIFLFIYLFEGRAGSGLGLFVGRRTCEINSQQQLTRDSIIRRERGQGGKNIPVQLTTSRIGNLMTIHTHKVCVMKYFSVLFPCVAANRKTRGRDSSTVG